MTRLKIGAIIIVVGALLILASCPPRESAPPKAATPTVPEITLPSTIPPRVEREYIGEVLSVRVTPRSGDLIVTTKNWVIESARVFPSQDLREGDWIDLVTVRIDESTTFQYLCTAETNECRRVFKMRKLLPGEAPKPAQ